MSGRGASVAAQCFLVAALVLLLALPAMAQTSPFGVGLPDQSGGGWLPWIADLQRQFYRDLTGALKALREDGNAFWWLAGLSFSYGVVHAAGPGHGKVVISSYLVATKQSARRGVLIAFLAAMAQAVVAILIVSIMAAALRMTSFAITDTARVLEVGSYLLIAALGIVILARKLREAARLLRPRPVMAPVGAGVAALHVHAHHDHHGHDDSCGCGHAHAPSPEVAAKANGIRGAAAAILAVGIRPCTGALIVLVFALAQGIFWAGVASTFLMALGTALAVAVLATLAVGARAAAERLAGSTGSRRGAALVLGVEMLGGLVIAALGTVLLAGALIG
ncbi:nickel/cobalt transporter [Faunimonas sp. B44]|uniref:nickel/cobalt transporter n=1 Tax=Faunimonas sp. B44 TaxID=3461493 RepID=UPI0040451114